MAGWLAGLVTNDTGARHVAAAMGIDSENLFNVTDGTDPWIEQGHPTSYGDDA